MQFILLIGVFLPLICLAQKPIDDKVIEDAARGFEQVGLLVESLRRMQDDEIETGAVLPWREIRLPVSGGMVFLRRSRTGMEAHVQRRGEHAVCSMDGRIVARIATDEDCKPPPADEFQGQQIVWSASRIIDYAGSPARVLYETDRFRMTHLIDTGEGAVAVATEEERGFLLRFDSEFRLLESIRIDARLVSGPGNDVIHYPKLCEIHIVTSTGFLFRYGYDGNLKGRIDAPGGSGPNSMYFHSRMNSDDRFFWASKGREKVYVYGADSGKIVREMSFGLTSIPRTEDYVQFCAGTEWVFLTGRDTPIVRGEGRERRRGMWWNILLGRHPCTFPQRIAPTIWRQYLLRPAAHSLFLLERETGRVAYRLACGQEPDEPGSVLPSMRFYLRHTKDWFCAESVCFDGNRIYAVGSPKELYPSVYWWEIPEEGVPGKASKGK